MPSVRTGRFGRKPLLPDINVHAKFEENRSETTRVRVRKRSADR